MYEKPTLYDVLKARQVIAPHVHRTPLRRYPSLSRLLGAQVYVKHENHQILGAFKVRGGINLVSNLSAEERRRGVITASTGNHAQSIAYAGRIFGVNVTIVMPHDANPDKAQAVRDLGANLLFHGKDFDEAREHVERLASKEGYRYVHAANEPLLIAGVGTCSLEIMEDLPEVDVIVAPIGGGSTACGACITAKFINPSVQVIGVQSSRAPAAYLSWKGRRIVESDLMETSAEGLATRVGFELTQRILWELLDDFILVSEAELNQAIVTYLERAHTLAEGAGAASLAGALKIKDRLRSKTVALILTGGNIALPQLREALVETTH